MTRRIFWVQDGGDERFWMQPVDRRHIFANHVLTRSLDICGNRVNHLLVVTAYQRLSAIGLHGNSLSTSHAAAPGLPEVHRLNASPPPGCFASALVRALQNPGRTRKLSVFMEAAAAAAALVAVMVIMSTKKVYKSGGSRNL